jgi:hypothetical protein
MVFRIALRCGFIQSIAAEQKHVRKGEERKQKTGCQCAKRQEHLFQFAAKIR